MSVEITAPLQTVGSDEDASRLCAYCSTASACAPNDTIEAGWDQSRFQEMLEGREVPGHARRASEAQRKFEEEALAAEEAERQEQSDADEHGEAWEDDNSSEED